jgi:hypothetical protein
MSDDSLDLDQVADQTSAEYTIRHPKTGAPTAAKLLLAGPEHEVRRQAVFGRMRARQLELERAGRISLPDPEADEADRTALVAVCTLGWTGLEEGGKPLVFTVDAARKLYADPKKRWLRDQALQALDQRELFIGSSAPA